MMSATPDVKNSTHHEAIEIQFTDIFDLDEIQRLQDLFSDATGVASIITYPDGTPITRPSNFCRLCSNIIRTTEKGLANCMKSYAAHGCHGSSDSGIQSCLSAGLWDSGTSITVGGKHLANWLIGQVRNEELNEQRMIEYADEIGANREEFRKALDEVPVMPVGQFKKVSEMLFAFADELSEKAYSNWQLKMQIAEREKATALLQKEEERYRTFFEHSNDALFLVDIATGSYLYANKAAEILTGRTLDELKRLTTRDITPNGAEERLEKLMETKDSLAFGEVEYIRPDGTKRTALLNKVFLSNSRVFGIANDITERKLAEQALRDSEQKYLALAQISPVGIFRTNAEGATTYVNPKWCQISGLSASEALGDGWLQAVHPDDREKLKTNWIKSVQKRSTSSAEYRFVRTDGSVAWVIGHTVQEKNSKEEIVGYVGTITDITERKIAEESLSRSEARHGKMVANIGDVIVIIDRNGNIRYKSPNIEKRFGWRLEEVVGESAWKHIHPEDLDSMRKTFADILCEPNAIGTVECRYQSKDGSYRWIEFTGTNLLHDPDIKGLLGNYRDITERKLAEENIHQHSEELATLLTISQEFATTLDLGTILQMTTDRVTELTELKSSAIYLLEGETLRLCATTPPLPQQFPEELRIAPLADHPHIRKAITTGMPVFIPNTATANLTPAERAVTEIRSLHSILYLPLIAGTKVLGTLIVTTIEKTRLLFEADINLCNTFANLAAMAVGNARLFESEQRYAVDLEQRVVELKQAEEIILKANRLYAVVSQINQIIVRTRNQDQLFGEVCRIAVEYGKFQMAWIGLIDEESQFVNPVAIAGNEDGYLSNNRKISVNDTPEGQGPTGTAIRTGKHFVCDDIERDSNMALWRDEALRLGYRSSIALPIKSFGKVIGAFNLYVSTPYFFDEGEIELLDEVTNDISFAIEIIEKEKKRVEAEDARQKSEEQFRGIYDQSPIAIEIYDADGLLVDVNQKCLEIFGIDDVRHVKGFKLFDDPNIPVHEIEKLKKGEPVSFLSEFDFEIVKEKKLYPTSKSGKIFWEVFIKPLIHENGTIFGYLFQVLDITGRKQAEEALLETHYQYRQALIQANAVPYLRYYHEAFYNYIGEDIVKYTGYSAEEFLPSIWNELRQDAVMLGECAGLSIEEAGQMIISKGADKQWISDYKIKTRSGEIRWINDTAVQVRDQKGKIIGSLGVLQDITERKRNEVLLIENSERYKALITVSNTGAWEYHLDTDFLWCSPEYFSMLGRDINQFDLSGAGNLNETWIDLLHPEDRQRASGHFSDYLKNGSDGMYENYFRMKHSDGHWVWILSRGSTLRDENGKITNLMVGTHIDITERKQEEENLVRSRKQLRIVADNAPVSIAQCDENMRYKFVNRQYANMFGMHPAEIKGKLVRDVVGEEAFALAKTYMTAALAGQQVDYETGRYTVPNGFRTLRVKYSPEEDKSGRVVGFIAAISDITERKQVETALLESEEKFRTITHSANDAIISIDSKGIIVDWNRGAEKIFGYSAAQMTGENVTSIIPKRFIEPHTKWIKRIAQDGAVHIIGKTVELFGMHKNGKEFPLELSLSEWGTYSSGKFYTGIIRDITERKLAEEKLNTTLNLLQETFASLNEAVLLVDTETRAIYECNPTAETMFGYSREELIGKTTEFLHVNDDTFVAFGEKTMEELVVSDHFNFEYRMKRKDGEVFPTEHYGRPIFQEGKFHTVVSVIRDITERKRADEILRESEERFRFLIEKNVDGILVLDEEGLILFANKTAEVLFNRPEQDLLGLSLGVPIEADAQRGIEIELPRGKEGYVVVEVRFAPSHWADRPVYLATLRDVTARKQAEEALATSRKELEDYFENDISADYLISLEGEILSCNKTFLELFGFEKKSVAEKFNIAQLYKNPAEREELIRKVKEIGKVENYEIDFITLEGKTIHGLINAIGIFNASGELVNTRGYLVDITARKNAEKTLLKLSRAVEQSPASIFITDTKGNIEYGNPKVTEITGYEPAELVGKNPRIFSTGETTKSEYKILWDTILSGREWRGEFHNKKKNGELYWEYATISPIFDEKGVITHFLAVKEDITQRKEMINELILAKEKAEESDRLKSSFLANMSHEIRTPMNGILGFAEILKEPDLTGEQQKEYIGIIEKSGARMLNIINDILDISKIESGQMKVSVSETNVNEQIEYIYNFFKPEVEQKGLQFLVKNTLSAKESILKTDKEKLYAIVANLVKNAIKFTKTGSIEIGYGSTSSPTGSVSELIELEFYVRDTGIGIRPEQKEFIFERFRQGSETLNKSYEGAGLGLSISKAFVKLLGGKIWVESEPGKGSVFYFTLPYSAEPE